jgi:hypothetical protein
LVVVKGTWLLLLFLVSNEMPSHGEAASSISMPRLLVIHQVTLFLSVSSYSPVVGFEDSAPSLPRFEFPGFPRISTRLLSTTFSLPNLWL